MITAVINHESIIMNHDVANNGKSRTDLARFKFSSHQMKSINCFVLTTKTPDLQEETTRLVG
jgi:hypothetical protein